MLRNRAYLGEVFYRDQWHRANPHHPPLIGDAVFVEAEQVLIARGDDHAHRAGANAVTSSGCSSTTPPPRSGRPPNT